jgi:excisionase family DNA binding protein
MGVRDGRVDVEEASSAVRLDDFPDVLTVEEAARVLRLGRNAGYQAVHRGEIRSIRLGRKLLIPKKEIERLLTVAGHGV